MQRYILRRFLHSLLAIWVLSMIVFSLARVTGNPLDVLLPLEAGPEEYERVAKHWGLDKPLYTQYLIFMGKALRGDFGTSWKWQAHTAMGLVLDRLPATLQLAGLALLISVVYLRAHRGDGRRDERHSCRFAVEADRSARPVIALLLARHRPDVGVRRATRVSFRPSGRGGLSYMVLPGIALGWFQVAALMRLTRSSMLEVLAGPNLSNSLASKACRSGKSSGSTVCAMPRSCR